MSTSGYRSKLKEYEELDEDELLATLSSEELQELERELADIQPDDSIPIGLRQKDQTLKIPTGAFDRDALLKYWEDENKKLLQDQKVEPKLRQEEQSEQKKVSGTNCDTCKTPDNDKKQTVHQERKAGKNRNAKKECEQEKRDECHQEKKGVIGGTRRTEPSSQSLERSSERLSGNPIVIDKALEQILRDEPTMTEVNLNNIEDVSPETLLRFAEALCTNTHVHVFSLANTHADDRVAFAISQMLCENRSIRTLNIESNFVSGQGLLLLLAALRHNGTLVELRFHNQRHICGGKVEMEMVQLLKENSTLLKLGYQFELPGPRMAATGILTRNQDQQRQRRLQQKKEQSLSEDPGHLSKLPTDQKPQKKPLQSHCNVENQRRNSPPSLDPPTRKIAEMVKHHEGSSGSKPPLNQRKPKSKKLKNGVNEKESAEILKDLKNALKPSFQKRWDESPRPPPPQRSSRDNLMAAIRQSSISSLKRDGG
ncbi:leiomodin-2-like [Salarias fasciatus]|uniref:leiomodin-2-like n=1 Tax=Salarias fasciatus TaxID=181472 RepID=UPI001176744F|nr:leiomodin-2-like [Salarias fasciatus]